MNNPFDPFSKAMQEALRKATQPNEMKKLGEEAAEMIKTRTRLGYGVERSGTKRERLDPLAESTKESKKQKRKRGELSPLTTPSRSNLTDTGELLDSQQVTSVAQVEVTIGPKGRRKDGKTNEEVGSYVTENGRPYNNLSDVEEKRITESLRKRVQNLVEKLTKAK